MSCTPVSFLCIGGTSCCFLGEHNCVGYSLHYCIEHTARLISTCHALHLQKTGLLYQLLYVIILLFAGWPHEGRQIIGRGSTFPAHSDIQHECTYMYGICSVSAIFKYFILVWYDIVCFHCVQVTMVLLF